MICSTQPSADHSCQLYLSISAITYDAVSEQQSGVSERPICDRRSALHLEVKICLRGNLLATLRSFEMLIKNKIKFWWSLLPYCSETSKIGRIPGAAGNINHSYIHTYIHTRSNSGENFAPCLRRLLDRIKITSWPLPTLFCNLNVMDDLQFL